MITQKALNYFSNTNMKFVSPKEWQCLTCKVKELTAKVDSLQTGLGLPDNIVTENEFNTLFHQHLVDAFGVPIP